MRILMIVLALILISCKKEIAPRPAGKGVDSVKVAVKDTTPKVDTTIEYKSCQSKQFTFSFKKDSVGNVRLLIIRDLKTDSVVQEIGVNYHAWETVMDDPEHFFELQDFDFDGIDDFGVFLFQDAHAKYQDIYVYDSNADQFVHDTEFSDKPNLSIDTCNQEIRSGLYQTGYAFDSFYKFQSKKLTKLRGQYTDWSDSDYTVTYYDVKNGQEIKTREASYKTLKASDSVEIKEYQYKNGKRILLKTGIYPEEKNIWHD